MFDKLIVLKTKILLLSWFVMLLTFNSISFCDVPHQINYQGMIKVNGTPFNSTGQFKFAIINSAGTVSYWSNDGTSSGGSQPTAYVTISVANGVYNINLGDTSITNMAEIPATIFDQNENVKLRIWFNDDSTGFQQLSPDRQLVAVGYSLKAEISDSANAVNGSVITSANITDGSIANDDISATAAIASTKISGLGSLATANSVGTNEITDGSITNNDISATAAIANTKITGLGSLATANSVGSSEITDNSITNSDLANDGASLSKISNGSMVVYNNSGINYIGLGTATPSRKLHILGDPGAGGGLMIGNTLAGTAQAQVIGYDGSSYNPIDIRSQSGTQLYLATNGKIGIGTTSPETLLDINPGASYAGYPTLQIVSSYADGYNAQLRLNNTYTGGRSWLLRAGNNSSGGIGNGFQIYDETASAARMHIDSNGNVGIGTTATSDSRLNIYNGSDISRVKNLGYGDGYTYASYEFGQSDSNRWAMGQASSNNNLAFSYYNGSSWSNVMNLTTGGRVGIPYTNPQYPIDVAGNGHCTGMWIGDSDERLKTDIGNLEVGTLDKIKTLNPIKYNFDKDALVKKYLLQEGVDNMSGTDRTIAEQNIRERCLELSKDRQIGLSAQELEKQFPELVKTDSNGYKSVAYGNLGPILIQAIKEQQKQIEDLKAEIDMLKNK